MSRASSKVSLFLEVLHQSFNLRSRCSINMSTPSNPAMRHTLGACAALLRPQRRWARVVNDVRFVATHRDQERILNRYKEKLEQKAKEYALRVRQWPWLTVVLEKGMSP